MSIDQKYRERHFSSTEAEKKALKDKPIEKEQLDDKIEVANIKAAQENADDLIKRSQNKFEAIKEYSETAMKSWKEKEFTDQIKNLEMLERQLGDIELNKLDLSTLDQIDELKLTIMNLRNEIANELSARIAKESKLDNVIPLQQPIISKPREKKGFFGRLTSLFKRKKDKSSSKKAANNK